MADQVLRKDLPEDVKEALDVILQKDPKWLVEHEIAFLKARRDYLTSDEKRVFAELLEEEKELESEAEQKKDNRFQGKKA